MRNEELRNGEQRKLTLYMNKNDKEKYLVYLKIIYLLRGSPVYHLGLSSTFNL